MNHFFCASGTLSNIWWTAPICCWLDKMDKCDNNFITSILISSCWTRTRPLGHFKMIKVWILPFLIDAWKKEKPFNHNCRDCRRSDSPTLLDLKLSFQSSIHTRVLYVFCMWFSLNCSSFSKNVFSACFEISFHLHNWIDKRKEKPVKKS